MIYDICLNIKRKSGKLEILKNVKNALNTSKIIIVKIGNVYNLKNKKMSLEDIEKFYYKFGNKINDYLDGTYSLIIFDYKIQKCYIYQDYFGNNQSIYYYTDEDDILISNKLKEIIVNKNEKWKLNRKAVNIFLDKGYIPDKITLIEKIYKLPSKKYLEIDLKKQKLKLINDKNFNKIKKEIVNEDIYNEALRSICTSEVKDFRDNIAITISSGYDTNYLLYTLNKISKKKIDAFCIGGKIGRNEIPDAKDICSKYTNVNFYSKLVDETSLNSYPEIVWALEGAIYEAGIFLQYELSKMISNNNDIILGECADQVLHYELYHKKLAILKKIKYNLHRKMKFLISGINCKPYKDIYEMASYKVIKKNGIMMNYFGVNPRYPYLRKRFIGIARNVVKIGDTKKYYHKKVINHFLPKDITKILKKIGGATELKTLFVGNIKLDELKNICKRSEFYTPKKFDDEFYEIDYFMKIVYIELFKKLFLQNNISMYMENNFERYDLTYFFPELKNKKVVD